MYTDLSGAPLGPTEDWVSDMGLGGAVVVVEKKNIFILLYSLTDSCGVLEVRGGLLGSDMDIYSCLPAPSS